MSRTYDVAILGATPAGLAAAYHLARRRCRATVIDSPAAQTECPLAEWVARDVFELAALPKSLKRNCRARPFRLVRYHSGSLDRHVDYRSQSVAGWFLRPGALRRALRAAAVKAGAKVVREPRPPKIHLGEDAVCLTGRAQTRARLLLMAQGGPSQALAELGLAAGAYARARLQATGLDVPLGSTRSHAALRGALHIIGSPNRNDWGIFFLAGALLHVRLVHHGDGPGKDSAPLSGLVARLREADVLPARLNMAKARGGTWRPPAGVALEMEIHATKRCLLAGTAGGFAETITGQTVFPSVRSALLAAETARAALQSRDLQGTLMSFKTSWRKSLASYLRPPNTSLQMLLPVLFTHRRMVERFSGALLYGRPI